MPSEPIQKENIPIPALQPLVMSQQESTKLQNTQQNIAQSNPSINYIMFYRHGMAPFAFKGFAHKGDLRSAINRANKHCAIMGYRLTFVTQLIENLDEIEIKQVNKQGGEVKMPDYSLVQHAVLGV